MARRSARLQKRSPTPSETASSASSWETAQPHSSPQHERLPSVLEGDEPAMKTPRKTATAASVTPGKAVKSSQLPQPTPHASARTPKNRTPIKPAGQDMHPAHHHASTAKMLDEARWLGFHALGAHTAPPKATDIAPGQTTPSKTPMPTTSPAQEDNTASPEFRFRFRFKSPLSGLSPTSNSILKNKEDALADGRTLFNADEFTAPADVSPKRKTAVPKGKMSRFSDVHMKEFKKMDSIANHPSAFRANPGRFKPVTTFLKKSPSKIDLEKAESSANTSNKLKRTQSKMDVSEPTMRIPPTPLKRTQSKMNLTGSSLPRAQSTVRLVPPSRDGRPTTGDGNPFAKRVKRSETDDAATTRPASQDGATNGQKSVKTATPARKITSQTALPRLASRLMTPTKASIARSQSAKATKSQSMIPSLLKSPSTQALFSPTNIGHAVKESVRDSIRKTSNSLQRVRSILRTPSRKFSEDPEQVAAGTHVSPSLGLNLQKSLPEVPHTAPVKKHVNFTNSTLERAALDELGKSPSPMKFRAGSAVPSGAVIYPTLQSGVQYHALPNGDETLQAVSPSRRLTFGGATSNTPGEFSFQSNKPISFPVSNGTIRMVRKSDASSLIDSKKRKLDSVEESSDKENSEPVQFDAGRSAKKMKPTPGPAEPPKTPSKTPSKLPRITPNRGSSISKSRLAFLATPRRNKA